MGFRSLASVVLIGIVLTGCGGGGGGGNNNNNAADSVENNVADAAPATLIPVVATSCTTELAAIFDELLVETNKVRSDHEVPELTFSYKLGQVAQGHAQHMADNNYFAHTSPDGSSTIASRINATDYKFNLAGENLAAGYYSAKDVVIDWLHSPGHRENLLHPDYTHVGFGLFFDTSPGVAPESTFESYWAQEFGQPTSNNTDTESAYIPPDHSCSIGSITSSGNALLNGAIAANKSVITNQQPTASALSSVVVASHSNSTKSTPEPGVILGVLPVVMLLRFSRGERLKKCFP
ncbi:MAG: CAP domain-containing protein [Leptolyngbya sp. SIO3F4]|nr:CAP domain-containing protein [Leptolyngbya sp. SIO3F4]